MPWSDWQFWVVTVAMLIGLWRVFRALVPRKKKGTKVSLTIGSTEENR